MTRHIDLVNGHRILFERLYPSVPPAPLVSDEPSPRSLSVGRRKLQCQCTAGNPDPCPVHDGEEDAPTLDLTEEPPGLGYVGEEPPW